MQNYYFEKINNLLMVVKKIEVLIVDLKEILILNKDNLSKRVKIIIFIQDVR